MAVFALVSFMTLSEVKVGGSMYSTIAIGDGVDADYAPPGGYIVAVRVIVYQMLEDFKDQSRLQSEIQHFEHERKVFEATHDRTARILPDGRLKDLMQKAY